MVRARRSTPGTRRTPSIHETSRRIRRNRRIRRLPHIIVSLDKGIVEPTPSTINQFPPSIPEIAETNVSTSNDLSPPVTEENTEIQEPLDTRVNTFASTTLPAGNNYTSLETTEELPEELSDFILEAEERNAEIAPNAVIPDQHNYSSEEDDFYPPPSYSPVTYEDLDPFAPLEIPQIETAIPIANIDSESSYIPPEMYDYSPEE